MTTSKPFLMLALVLTALGAAAQDVEPTPERAIRAVVSDLVSELPWRVPNGEALAIVAEPGSDRQVVEAFTAALIRSGFTVRAGEAEGGVPVAVSTRPAGNLGELSVSSGDFTTARRYGKAHWVDRPVASEKMLVIGSPATSIDGAIQSARNKLSSELSWHYPAVHRERHEMINRAVLREPSARFIAARTVNGKQVFEAYVLAEPGFDRFEREERAVHRRAQMAVWLRYGSIGGAGLLLWLLYLRADFRTRGWRTTRLRFLFGTLFVAISACLLWNFPQ